MAKIIKIKIEGFGSILGKITYKFDRPGICLILGKNGSGKTTIFNALSWALYGQLLKPKSTFLPWPHITPKEFRGCRVIVELDNETQIIRCADFKGKLADGKKGGNRLIILQNSLDRSDLRNKTDLQREITRIIGYSFQLFKTSVLFAQELSSIAEDDGPTRKRVFDEAFESIFIQRAKDLVEGKLNTLENEDTSLRLKIANKVEMLEINQAILKQLSEEKAKFAIEKARKIKDLRREVKDIRDAIKAIKKGTDIATEKRNARSYLKELGIKRDELVAGLDKSVDKFISLNQEKLTEYERQLSENKKEQKIIKSQKPQCRECGSPLGGRKLKTYERNISQQRKYLKDGEKELKGLIKFTRKQLERFKKSAQEQLSIEEQLKEIRAKIGIKEGDYQILDKRYRKIKLHQNTIRGLKKQIGEVRRTKNNINTQEVEERGEKLIKSLNELKGNLKSVEKKLEIQRWLLKDPLSNSGLKAFIFDSMLRKTNHYLQYYTKYIGFRVMVAMDLESAHKDFMITVKAHGAEVSFADLSRGQKQLAKVALCFALNDTTQASKPINILLMDELFESLDPENIEIVGSIIQEKAKNKSIHIITHKSKFNPQQAYKTFVSLNDQKQTVIEQKYKDA